MPLRRPILSVLAPAAIACIVSISNAQAASFDCSKAKQPDEKAICGNQGLSDLDVQMAALYGVRMQIPMLMGAKGAAQDEQRAFLAMRATCGGNVACVRQAYEQRIFILNQTISAAMHDYCIKVGICG
jgi:uncharacterized protein